MPFFRIDEAFWSHPKMLALTPVARDLWTRAGSYSMQHLTDGLISKSALTILGAKPKQIRELVEAGLWNEVLIGYQFHDWDDYQETADRLKDRRDKARERMRNLRSKPDDTDPEGSDSVRANTPRTGDARSEEVSDVARGSIHPIPSMADSGLEPSVPETSRENATDSEEVSEGEYVMRASRLRVDFRKVRDRYAAQAEDAVPNDVVWKCIWIVVSRGQDRGGDRTGLVISSLRKDWSEWSRLVFQVAS